MKAGAACGGAVVFDQEGLQGSVRVGFQPKIDQSVDSTWLEREGHGLSHLLMGAAFGNGAHVFPSRNLSLSMLEKRMLGLEVRLLVQQIAREGWVLCLPRS